MCMKREDKNLIVLCGPTASGKTRLAVSVAQHVQGEIISADSRQVYRGMDIGTGKDLFEYTTPLGTVPYHLIDIIDPSEIYSLFYFQQDCFRAIREIRARNNIPVMAGGTGLYIEAVLKYYKVPNVPENQVLRNSLMKKTKVELSTRLKSLDPALYTSTDVSSKKRIARSIEVALFARNHTLQWGITDPPAIDPLIIGVTWPRAVLFNRIDKRLNERLEGGMIEEVERLLKSGISVKRFKLLGMEYKHIIRYLLNEVTYDIMVTDLRNDIRRLSKRQMTYFRGFDRRGLKVIWVENPQVKQIIEIVNRYNFDCSINVGIKKSGPRNQRPLSIDKNY